MRNIAFLLILVSLFAGCQQNTKVKVKTEHGIDKDIYDVVNICLASRDTRESTAIWNVEDELSTALYYENPASIKYLKKYFLEEHATDIAIQLKDSTIFYLKQEKILKDARVVSSDTLRTISKRLEKEGKRKYFWQELQKRYEGWLITISKPLFSKNKDFAILYMGTYNGGTSSGNQYKLRKKNGRWEIEKISPLWIS